MSKHLEIGKRGELIAEKFLVQNGYTILVTNWRKQKGEIDIIAKEEDLIVFIEVKTRSGSETAIPESAINRKKKEILCRTAFAYMEEIDWTWAFRFDIVSVLILSNQIPIIQHFKDVFDPLEP